MPGPLRCTLRSTALLAAVLTTATSVFHASAAERPAYQNLPYEENWSRIHQAADSDAFDPLKAIALDTEGWLWLSLGGSLRLRGEGWSNFNFDGSGDGAFGLSQLRLHADLHAGDVFRLYVEGISALSSPRSLPGGTRSLDADALDLQNLFIDLRWPLAEQAYLLLRPGRQELDFGRERLVSSLRWANSRRSFDGVRAIGAWNGLRADLFYAQPVSVSSWDANASSPASSLYGLYASAPLAAFSAGLPFGNLVTDLYWLGLHKASTSFQGISGAEDRQTLGGRLGGKLPLGFDAELEGAWQFGRFADQAIQAGFVASELGYQPEGLAAFGRPRLILGADYASGDGSRTDRTLQTFNQLYPLGHAYYGIADLLGRQNAIDLQTGLSLTPLPGLSASLRAHQFLRASTVDDVYGVGGAALRSGDKSLSPALGTELDLILNYKADSHLSFEAGYSHVFPGAFMAESGPAEGLDFAYLSTSYVF